jgi:hypothetical protein
MDDLNVGGAELAGEPVCNTQMDPSASQDTRKPEENSRDLAQEFSRRSRERPQSIGNQPCRP